MKQVRALVVRTAGTNCDEETIFALRHAGAEVSVIHINQLRKQERPLKDFHIFCIPGGFSYGDNISAGKVLALEFSLFLRDELEEFISNKGLVIGICNGFQVLVKTGILPATDSLFSVEVSLIDNDCGRFVDEWVDLEVVNRETPWTQLLRENIISMPVAHGEGKFVASDAVIDRIANNKQIVFRYTNGTNPNGSVLDIAGICDPTGQVLGMMPHPERAIVASQYPHWSKRIPYNKTMPPLDIFHSAISWVKANVI